MLSCLRMFSVVEYWVMGILVKIVNLFSLYDLWVGSVLWIVSLMVFRMLVGKLCFVGFFGFGVSFLIIFLMLLVLCIKIVLLLWISLFVFVDWFEVIGLGIVMMVFFNVLVYDVVLIVFDC